MNTERRVFVLAIGIFLLNGALTIAEPTRIFDGKTLNGWEGPLEHFRIEDGAIVGGSLDKPIALNQFLATTKSYANFELRLEFKALGDNVNAGIQMRSQRVPDSSEMIGYQADIGDDIWGALYDESRRRRMLQNANYGDRTDLVDTNGWNDYRMRCEGRRVRLWVNGHKTVDYFEPDTTIEPSGHIGLQIHLGPPSEAWYRNITIEELPATSELEQGIRGVMTRATGPVTVDGDLSEFAQSFVAPMEYFNERVTERAAQFFYMWDDESLYVGLRTLDTIPAHAESGTKLYDGDSVEFYLDTRRDERFRNAGWGPGAAHVFFTGMTGIEVKARYSPTVEPQRGSPKIGIDVASRRTPVGIDVEFKMAWANFPDFKARVGQVIGLDTEVCYSDGRERVGRSFIYGSPLNVPQPASLGRVQLVDSFRSEHWRSCGPILSPVRCDTPWEQSSKNHVKASMALPPNRPEIGRVIFRVTDTHGSFIAEHEATSETFAEYGSFRRAVATWPSDFNDPGTYHITGILHDRDGNELTRVAPRMVSLGMNWGY
jgi:hypothetical protein